MQIELNLLSDTADLKLKQIIQGEKTPCCLFGLFTEIHYINTRFRVMVNIYKFPIRTKMKLSFKQVLLVYHPSQLLASWLLA